MTKAEAEIIAGKEAGRQVKSEVAELLESKKATSLKRVILRLGQALDAKVIKATYDREGGEWQYSMPLVDNSTRLKAVELALTLHDAFPAKKHELTGKNGGPIKLTLAERLKEMSEEES